MPCYARKQEKSRPILVFEYDFELHYILEQYVVYSKVALIAAINFFLTAWISMDIFMISDSCVCLELLFKPMKVLVTLSAISVINRRY